MFERFDEAGLRIMVHAQEEARHSNHPFIGTEHLLLGLCHDSGTIPARALEYVGVTLEAARQRVEDAAGVSGAGAGGTPLFTPRAKRVLELSLREALVLGHSHVGPEHFLLGLVKEGQGLGARILVELAGSLDAVRDEVLRLLAEPGAASAYERHDDSPR